MSTAHSTTRRREGTPMKTTNAATDLRPAEVAVSLRTMLSAIDAGEVEASSTERAYLMGAADALERVTVK